MEQQVTPAAEPSFREQVEAAETQPVETVSEQPEALQETVETEETPQEQKTVPLGALHEERQKRKRAEQAWQNDRQTLSQLQQQQVEMMRYMQSLTQPQPTPVPSFEADPLTNIGAAVHQTREQLAHMQQEMQRKDAETQ
jgi:hypothetical protein